MKYFEKISNQTINEVSAFLKDHPEKQLQYWDWRESNQLALKVYKELEESTKGFGEEIDIILERNNLKNPREVSFLEMKRINDELSQVVVIQNVQIHKYIEQLESKTFLRDKSN